MIVDEDGLIHFLYCIEYSKTFYAYSEDNGKIFSEPVEITTVLEQFKEGYSWKVINTGPGHEPLKNMVNLKRDY